MDKQNVVNFKFFKLFILLSTISLLSSCDPPIPPDPDSLIDIAYSPKSYVIDSLKGFPPIPEFVNNPLTYDGVQLGRHLFFDPILSSDSTQSCSSCHNPRLNFTDGQATSKGVLGQFGNRSSMALINLPWSTTVGFFWDGRAVTMEDQALQPVINPIELHEEWPNVENKLRRHTKYPELFRKAFGIDNKQQINKDLAVKAIAQYERILLTGSNSLFMRQKRGEVFYNNDQQTGHDLFFNIDPLLPDAECFHCHAAPLFSSSDFFNNGLDSVVSYDQFIDKGRGMISGLAKDNGKFKAPSLINIEYSAPYMHDGRFKTLEEVVDHYNAGGHPAPNKNVFIRNLNLTNREKKQLVIFLKTLTDTSFLKNPDVFSPF